jgi:putative FmdB family regulatory protein
MIYEYRCDSCNHVFDVQATLAEKEQGLFPSCPDCNSRETSQVFSAPGILSGDGHRHAAGHSHGHGCEGGMCGTGTHGGVPSGGCCGAGGGCCGG